jgi:hypothetical protein
MSSQLATIELPADLTIDDVLDGSSAPDADAGIPPAERRASDASPTRGVSQALRDERASTSHGLDITSKWFVCDDFRNRTTAKRPLSGS